MYETYAYSLQNKWSDLQKYDRIWKLTNKITVNNKIDPIQQFARNYPVQQLAKGEHKHI